MSANYLGLGARAVSLLLILTSSAFADRMTFAVKGIGGNASSSSYWIAAEGDIEKFFGDPPPHRSALAQKTRDGGGGAAT